MGWDRPLLGGKEFPGSSAPIPAFAQPMARPSRSATTPATWEVGLLGEAAAKEPERNTAPSPLRPIAQTPAMGRHPGGTIGMFDSLPYRNEGASVFGRHHPLARRAAACSNMATCDP